MMISRIFLRYHILSIYRYQISYLPMTAYIFISKLFLTVLLGTVNCGVLRHIHFTN